MRINPINFNNINKKSNTSFKGVQTYAVEHYMQTPEFQNNEIQNAARLLKFVKEQRKNSRYVVTWHPNIKKYVINRMVYNKEPVRGSEFDTVEFKYFTSCIGELEALGLPYEFNDIYEAGSVCDMIEQSSNALIKNPANRYNPIFNYCV